MNDYVVPAGIDKPLLKKRAARRRAALVAHGCATYELGWREGLPRILCLCCGLGSYHTNDIKERFCGFCGSWHGDWVEEENVADVLRTEIDQPDEREGFTF